MNCLSVHAVHLFHASAKLRAFHFSLFPAARTSTDVGHLEASVEKKVHMQNLEAHSQCEKVNEREQIEGVFLVLAAL